MSAQPTPRPWASGGDEVYAGQGDTYSEVCRMYGDAPLADDNADLIVAAVNDYDRLLAVEAAFQTLIESVEFYMAVRPQPDGVIDFTTVVAESRAALARPAEEQRG